MGLDAVEIVMDVEDHFGISIKNSEATKQLHLRSVDVILDELKPIIVETLGVDASEVVPTARFVDDLGMG